MAPINVMGTTNLSEGSRSVEAKKTTSNNTKINIEAKGGITKGQQGEDYWCKSVTKRKC